MLSIAVPQIVLGTVGARTTRAPHDSIYSSLIGCFSRHVLFGITLENLFMTQPSRGRVASPTAGVTTRGCATWPKTERDFRGKALIIVEVPAL